MDKTGCMGGRGVKCMRNLVEQPDFKLQLGHLLADRSRSRGIGYKDDYTGSEMGLVTKL
jgi:hypothetical protein